MLRKSIFFVRCPKQSWRVSRPLSTRSLLCYLMTVADLIAAYLWYSFLPKVMFPHLAFQTFTYICLEHIKKLCLNTQPFLYLIIFNCRPLICKQFSLLDSCTWNNTLSTAILSTPLKFSQALFNSISSNLFSIIQISYCRYQSPKPSVIYFQCINVLKGHQNCSQFLLFS